MSDRTIPRGPPIAAGFLLVLVFMGLPLLGREAVEEETTISPSPGQEAGKKGEGGAETGDGKEMKIEVQPGYPMLENDEAMLDLFVNVAGRVIGPAKIVQQGPSFGAEDMAYFLQKVPGANYWLGCAPPGQGRAAMLHSPEFDPDEAVMPLGVEMMVSLAEAFLDSGRRAD